MTSTPDPSFPYEGLTPDELNAWLEIPCALVAELEAAAEREGRYPSVAALDREVLRRWYAMQEGDDGNDTEP